MSTSTEHDWVSRYEEGREQMKPVSSFYNSDEIRALGIQCGDGCLLHKHALVYNCENIILGKNVRIDAFTILSPSTGFIHIGDFTHVSSHCLFIGAYKIEIFDYSAIAAGSKLYTVSDDMHGRGLIGPMVPPETRHLKTGPIYLNKHTCLAVNSVVLPNTILSEGSVLLANSLLRGVTEPYSLYSGTPAVRVKDRSTEFLKYL